MDDRKLSNKGKVNANADKVQRSMTNTQPQMHKYAVNREIGVLIALETFLKEDLKIQQI